MTEIRTHRPLSPLERMWTFMHELSPLHVVASVHLEGALSASALRAGARAATAAHPLLRVRIHARADGADPWFMPMADPVLPIRTVEADIADAQVVAREIDYENTDPVDPARGPLARLVDVVRGAGTEHESHDLILTAGHVIADGRGLVSVLRGIVEEAARFEADGVELEVRSRDPLPAADDLLPRRTRSVPRAAGVSVADALRTALRRPLRLRTDAEVPITGRWTATVRRRLTRDEVELLGAACREHGVTVQGALLAAMALALGADLDAGARASVVIGSAVDIRRDLEPVVDPADLGFYAATVPLGLPCGPEAEFWAIAGKSGAELRARVRRRTHLTMFAATRLVTPKSRGRAARVIDLVDRKGPINLFITNIGRVDFPERIGAWAVSAVQFTGGLSCTGRFALTVSTHCGAMYLNFIYVDRLISAQRVERTAERALAALRAHAVAVR
ncbi:hypothetical protein [Nocardia sp. NPDC056000]|uniref:phthiocerol/phthiodiolone dimycocerosyl transferase family protein n=1 Tax=Nocardia sp. NPDC056000 TaxID=3345674 RepID=UPI0035DC0773